MMWLKKGPDGKPDGGVTEPYCYHIDQFESLRPVFMQVIGANNGIGYDSRILKTPWPTRAKLDV